MLLPFIDLPLSNIYYLMRHKNCFFPIVLHRSVHFRMGRNARIERNGGRLYLGCKWDISRYKQSEMKICDNGRLIVNGRMEIFTGCSIDICIGATLSLGSGFINNNSRIVVFDKIDIGDGVAISEGVTLRDSDNHGFVGSSKPVTAPITICDNVWIGMNATILKGVTIGEGAVVGANSLVNKDVPPHTLVGGVPAKVLRENVFWQ